jgi:hypothetical protein
MSERRERAVLLFSHALPPIFGYDPEQKNFLVGGEWVSLGDFPEHNPEAFEPADEASAARLVDEAHMILSVFDTPCAMPKLSTWLNNLGAKQARQLSEDVTEVLIDAYAEVGDAPRNRLLKGDLWGFTMSWQRRGQPTVSVLGNCACAGIDLEGNFFKQKDWGEGFAEFTLHNVDWQAQRTSLYAGMGSLAYFAEQAQAL